MAPVSVCSFLEFYQENFLIIDIYYIIFSFSLFQDVFARIDGMSAVTKQPDSKDENIKALQVVLFFF